jgi:4-hydroxybenzoate polyprenyltransferase
LLIVPPAVAVTGWNSSLYVLPAIAAFSAWTIYAIRFASNRKTIDIPGAVVRLIAGIALVDAMFAAAAGRPDLALAAAAMLPLTRLFQRFIPGT